jgi:hypothetical protein
MHEKIASVKKFVVAHKTALAVTATAVISYSIHHAAIKDHNDFLAEHGLLNEFYNSHED